MNAGIREGVSGIILAGVHRWGECGLESLLPRPLLPVAESPLICYGLRWLRDAGIVRSTICANSESTLVRRCLRDGSQLGLSVHYYEDTMPRGPAGCVHDAMLFDPAEKVVVIEGCVIPEMDLDRLLEAHVRSDAALTVVVQPDGDRSGGSALRPAGIYVFSRRAISQVSPTGYQDIKELLIPRLHAEGLHVAVYVSERACTHVTDAATYVSANENQIARVAAGEFMPSDYLRRDAARIHVSAAVASDARLVGPVIVGPGSRIASRATVVGPTAIGAECVIAPGAVVCRSIIWDHGYVGDGAMLDRCILATYATVGANEQLSNRLCAARDGFRLRDRTLQLAAQNDAPPAAPPQTPRRCRSAPKVRVGASA